MQLGITDSMDIEICLSKADIEEILSGQEIHIFRESTEEDMSNLHFRIGLENEGLAGFNGRCLC